MNEDSYFNPIFMKEQCDAAIHKLQRDNEALDVVEDKLDAFIVNEEIQSQAFQALKQQLSDYKTVIQAMRVASDSDMMDFTTLKDLIGDDEVLDGGNILAQKQNALYEKQKDEVAAMSYEAQAGTATVPWMEVYYRWKANQYWNLADIDQRLYNKWQEKEDRYDEIEYITSGLFVTSEELRIAAQAALTDITGVFREGIYVPDLNAPWRGTVTREYNKIVGAIVNQVRTVHADGTVEYDWIQINAWLKQEAEDLKDIEYLAFLETVDKMSEEDLETLANMAYLSNDDTPMIAFDYKLSPVFVELAARYQKMTEITAALTIYDADSAFIYDKNTVINQLSRSQVLQLITNMDIAGTLLAIDQKHVKVTSVEQDGLLTYSLTLIRSDSYGVHSGEAVEELITGLSGGDVSRLTFTIYPWGSSDMAEFHLDQYARMTMHSMEKSGWEVTGDELCSFLISKGIDSVEPTGLVSAAAGYLQSQGENYEQTVQINGAIDAIDAGNYVKALGISTGVVATEGFITNRVAFTNAVPDRRELTVRLALYNQSHEPITEQAVWDSLEQGGEGLESYLTWYYQGQGCDEVEEYWSRLDNISKEYLIKNPLTTTQSVRDFSIEQLQELIKKEADPSYQINDTVMEGK